MQWRSWVVVVVVAVVMLGTGCGKKGSQSAERSGKPVVYTTFYPTKYFAERIGGDLLDVVCPVPEDEDVIFWMPDAKAIVAYQQADLVIINGAGFEKWVAKVSLPPSKLIDTARPLTGALVKFKSSITHSHGPTGQHDHVGVDGHT